MGFKAIIKRFESGNVMVFGAKGKGKDLLFGNVIARRKQGYVSNLDYGGDFHQIDFRNIDCGTNTYIDFINNKVKFYEYPYNWGDDIYISDCGVYFPSQYCNELNRDFKYFPVFFALSRQIAEVNVHCNSQALGRVWDKIREQTADTYLYCRWCLYIPFFDIVIQMVTEYDTYDSALKKVKPFKRPAQSRKMVAENNNQTRNDTELERGRYEERNGFVRNHLLIYHNRSKHDPLMFGKKLFGGLKNEK